MKSIVKSSILLMAIAIAFFSCSKDDNLSSTDSTSTTDTDIDAITVSGCSGTTGIEQIVCLADAFEAQLDASQLATVQLDYSVSDAKKWSNFPEAIYGQRVGLNFGSMTKTQIKYAMALIKAVSGTTTNEGYDEIVQLLYADEYLKANGGGSDYGYANYFIAFLGTPASTGTFEIQFGGHHFAFANTYTNGVLAGATPSFRGVEPFATFTWKNKSCQPIQQEQAALSAMLTGLSSTELATAKLSGTYTDLIAGPQKDDAFPSTASGIACSNLTSAQKTLVLTAIKTYVLDIADYTDILTKYTDELDDTYISYSGTTGITTKYDYVRIDGPSVWIEYSVGSGVVLSGTHPHSVWRDKSTDYGGN